MYQIHLSVCPLDAHNLHEVSPVFGGKTRRVLPFYRRAEAWADLVKERACICLEKHRLSQQPEEPLSGDSQRQASNFHQRQLKYQREQKHALQQAQQELLALPVSMLAQLLVKSPHLYVDPHILRGREELQWQLKQLALLSPSTMLAAVCEGVAYHNAGKLFFYRKFKFCFFASVKANPASKFSA